LKRGKGDKMGVYIELKINPDIIKSDQWEKVYIESLGLIKAYDFMMFENQDRYGIEISVMRKAEERYKEDSSNRHWRVCGDLISKKWAEGFSVYFDLNRYINRFHTETSAKDILFDYVEESSNIFTVFSGKTQGYPYHLNILAIACLFESRFKGAALVRGDISREQAEIAVKWANGILEEQIKIPICVDENELIKRIKDEYKGVEAVKLYNRLIIEEAKYFSATLFENYDYNDIKSWFREQLIHYTSPSQLGAIEMYIEWLNCNMQIEELYNIVCINEDGPNFDVIDFVKALCSTWIFIPIEDFKYLKLLEKTSEDPATVMYQFGNMFLDMTYMGRKIKVYKSKEEVIEIFNSICADKIIEITDLINKEYNDAIDDVAEVNDKMKCIGDEMDEKGITMDFEDAVLYFIDETGIDEAQKEAIKTSAELISEVIKNKEYNNFSEYLTDSIEESKVTITRIIKNIGLALTENAWDFIYKTEDIMLLHVLITISPFAAQEKKLLAIERAILENENFAKYYYGIVLHLI
jgi:hypothetical protein